MNTRNAIMRKLLIGCSLATMSALGSCQSLIIGDNAPAFKVGKWVKGTPVDTLKRGNIYVVEFWATWCGPCKQSIPMLTNDAKKYDGKATFIGVSVSEQDTSKVEPYVSDMGDKMSYNVCIDDQDSPTAKSGFMSKNWMAAASQNGIPTAFIIGKTGLVEWIGSPFSMDTALEQIVDDKYDLKSVVAKVRKHREDEETAKREDAAWRENVPLGKQVAKLDALFKAKDWNTALKELEVEKSMQGDKHLEDPYGAALHNEMIICGYLAPDMDRYYKCANQWFELVSKNDDEKHNFDFGYTLNNFAWDIGGPDSKLPRKDYDFAIRIEQRVLDHERKYEKASVPNCLDTLAWLYYDKGDKAMAISTESEAVRLGSADSAKADPEFLDALKKFQGP